MLATTYLSWWRRKWRTEVPTSSMPERTTAQDATADDYAAVELRSALGRALAGLPRQQRAVLMLRFHADLIETATAAALGIGVGTVKSYTARALARLRDDPAVWAIVHHEEVLND